MAQCEKKVEVTIIGKFFFEEKRDLMMENKDEEWSEIPLPFLCTRTCSNCNWVKKMNAYLRSTFGKKKALEYVTAVSSLNDLRTSFCPSMKTKTLSDLNKLWVYNSFLVSVDQRFPISVNNVSVLFKWNAILTNAVVSSYSVKYERTNILWNIAALMSEFASKKDMTSDTGIKEASYLFQQAAGVFNYLQKYIVDDEELDATGDVHNELYVMLEKVFLACAQYCFYKKAKLSKLDRSVVAKVAQGGIDLVDEALDVEWPETGGQILAAKHLSSFYERSLGLHWLSVFKGMKLEMQAEVDYCQSLIMESKYLYGHQVAYLLHGYNGIAEFIKTYEKTWDKELKAHFSFLSNHYKTILITAEKENDTIYHELVPKYEDLDSPQSKIFVAVKPPADHEFDATPINDPFKDVIPVDVIKNVEIYTSMREKIQQDINNEIDQGNEVISQFLNNLGYPGALEAYLSPVGIPDNLKQKHSEFVGEGGISTVTDLITLNSSLSKSCLESLEYAMKSMDEEEMEDNQLRNIHGGNWTARNSHSINYLLKSEATQYKNKLDSAAKTDTIVLNKWENNRNIISKLSGSLQDLEKMVPANSSSSSASNANSTDMIVVNQLRELLREVNAIVQERSEMKNQLQEKIEKDNITASLIQNKSETKEVVFDKNLSVFRALMSELANFNLSQQTIMQNMQQIHQQFLVILQSDTTSRQREVVLQEMNTAFYKYKEITSNLRDGVQFYTGIQGYIENFVTKTLDFVLARKEERKELEQHLVRQKNDPNQFSRPTMASAPQIPPQVPPRSNIPASCSSSSSSSPIVPPPSVIRKPNETPQYYPPNQASYGYVPPKYPR